MIKTILIVDDDAVIRLLLRSHLEAKGYVCSVASDGREALEMLVMAKYHLLITDLQMPRMSGLELIEQVRNRGLVTRCIVITGFATLGNLTDCLVQGAVALVPKPLRSFELLDKAMILAFEQIDLWMVQMTAIVHTKTEQVTMEPGGDDH